jgi:prolyl-tRNA synthetase
MHYSQMFIPTLREDPAEAEVLSHRLMLRGGMIRKLAAGIYSYLPLAQRVFAKVENIVRTEMNRAGAQEVTLPFVHPSEIWRESGRWDAYGKELLRFRDRGNRDFCLGPTHEEVITDLVKREVSSYRQLPLILYQIQTKFRDEIRPRFGVMRAREFVMKDAYSFDVDEEGAEKAYQRMYEAYCRIFERCGLKFRAVEADTGAIGGSFSHEFMVLADTGEDQILSCDTCSYAANLARAEVGETGVPEATGGEPPEMGPVETPGMKTVAEVGQFLGVSPQQIAKTLIFQTEQGAVAGLVRGDHEVNEVKLAQALGVESVELADEKAIEELTGGPKGFSGPVGLACPIVADLSLKGVGDLVSGGNALDLHIMHVSPGRDFSPTRFADIRIAVEGDRCPRCGGVLRASRGIEVGHVFKLGTKYSKAMGASFLDDRGRERHFIMGCYGIGIGRTVAAAIEQNHDENGIIFPFALAPFEVIVSPVNVADPTMMATAEHVAAQLESGGIEVLLDDRDERPGIKFKDADLIGIPLRVTVGKKVAERGTVDIRVRKTGESFEVAEQEVLAKALEIVRSPPGL